MKRIDKKLRLLCIEVPNAEFPNRGRDGVLERDRFGDVIAKTDVDSVLIVDEEFVNMNLEELAILLESGGW